MRAYIYVDGFNLYYRALKRAGLKWLNLGELSQRLLDPKDTVEKIKYFTARISPRAGQPDAPRRQQIYLSALKTIPTVEVHYGRFLPKKKWRPLVSTGQIVQIRDTEEKGSDVNLATHLLNDGWQKRYDIALVLSQDTDLIEPIRIVTKELKLIVGVVWLDGGNPSKFFKDAASFIRHVKKTDLTASQFPNPIVLPDGSTIPKPGVW